MLLFQTLNFHPDLWAGARARKVGFERLFSSGFDKLLKYLYLIAIFKTFIELSVSLLVIFTSQGEKVSV